MGVSGRDCIPTVGIILHILPSEYGKFADSTSRGRVLL